MIGADGDSNVLLGDDSMSSVFVYGFGWLLVTLSTNSNSETTHGNMKIG